MKIQYASDLHLEFSANSSFLKRNPLLASGDILILAGDIGYLGDDNYSKHPFWDWASESYRQVIVVPGNHELYKSYDINNLHNGWKEHIRENVVCYYNCVVRVENVDIIASTLWGHIRFEDAYRTENAVSDFKRIRNGEELLTWERFNAEHERCVDFIKSSVAQSSAKHIVVVSHHLPSGVLSAPEHKGSPINGAFAAELFDYIYDSPIDYWIYGHSHRNIDAQIGKTMCVSNQLGYVFAAENESFNPEKCIEL